MRSSVSFQHWMTSEAHPAAGRRHQTLLITDIVRSTENIAKLGDRRWRELLEQHDAIVYDAVDSAGGRVLTDRGDGFLIAFDSPAAGGELRRAAVHCHCRPRRPVAGRRSLRRVRAAGRPPGRDGRARRRARRRARPRQPGARLQCLAGPARRRSARVRQSRRARVARRSGPLGGALAALRAALGRGRNGPDRAPGNVPDSASRARCPARRGGAGGTQRRASPLHVGVRRRSQPRAADPVHRRRAGNRQDPPGRRGRRAAA